MHRFSLPNRTLTSLLFCCALLTSTQDTAAHDDIFRLGLTGSATLNMHRGTLDTYEGLLECGTFEDANTISWMAGNTIWYPLSPSWALNARIQYWKADGTFSSPNDVQPNVSLPDGSLVRMQSDYELQTTLDYINVDLLAFWYLTDGLFVGLGPQLGFNTRALFEQKEVIVEPSFLEFTQGGRERTFLSASFEQNGTTAQFRLGVSAMIGYDFRVHPNIIITPEVGYTYGITSVLSSSDWKVHAARAGVSVYWAFTPAPDPVIEYITSEPANTPPPQHLPIRSMRMDVQSVMSDGSRMAGADIVITELRSSDVVPLLPFVFFDAGSATIPSRYHVAQRGSFKEAELQDSILGIYHHLLNIVGERMNLYPDATLAVGGYREPADGENDALLASARADVVKDYLVRHWKIDAARISTSTGVLPSIISNRSLEDGRTENRRSELSSNDPRILAPVTLTSVQRSVEPSAIVIAPHVVSNDAPTSMKADIALASREVVRSILLSATENTWTVDATAIAAALGSNMSGTGTITANAVFADGSVEQDDAMLTARRLVRSSRFSNEVVNDSIIERFRLIFFDFDKPTVSDFNRSTIDLIRSRIRTTSSMRVTGLTDRIGPEEHNQQLSQRRAESIEKVIKERIVPEHSTAKGAGPLLIYNNDLPEGRWYNRTVLIEVATPVEDQR